MIYSSRHNFFPNTHLDGNGRLPEIRIVSIPRIPFAVTEMLAMSILFGMLIWHSCCNQRLRHQRIDIENERKCRLVLMKGRLSALHCLKTFRVISTILLLNEWFLVSTERITAISHLNACCDRCCGHSSEETKRVLGNIGVLFRRLSEAHTWGEHDQWQEWAQEGPISRL